MGPYQVLQLRVRADLGAMAMKGAENVVIKEGTI